MLDVGVVAVPVSVFWSMLSFRPTVSSKEIASFLSMSSPTSTSQVSSGYPNKRERRLSESTAFVTILRRRRRIFSRIFSESTSGPSKSLAMMRKPPRGNRVILRASAPCPLEYRGEIGAEQTHKKDKDQRRNVRNRKIFVIHAIERSRRRNTHRNSRR